MKKDLIIVGLAFVLLIQFGTSIKNSYHLSKLEKDLKDTVDVVYNLTDNQIQDSIKELEKIQDNMQVKILELKDSHKQQTKEIKLRFIEDIVSLKELIRWKQLINKKYRY